MIRCTFRPVIIGFFLAALVNPIQAFAQDQEDDHSVRSARLGLVVPAGLRSEKRRHAKRGGWAWTLASALAAGYDSNLHRGPSNREDTAVFEGAMRGELLHYFNRDSRLRVRAEVDAVPYTATHHTDDYRQKVSIFYGQRLSDDLKFSLGGQAEHANDSVTTSQGNTLQRDFEAWNYRIRPSLSYKFGDIHRIRVQYAAKRKDYDETSLKNSLDWWSHGPRIFYDVEVTHDLSIGLSYAFKVQNYDEEPAALRDGTEPLGNPDEKHYFHRVQADASWEVRDWLELTMDFGWKRKNDRFKDFESYDNLGVGLGAKISVAGFLISAEVDYLNRDFDNRPDSGTGNLKVDRVDFGLAARTQITRAVGLFGGYDLRWRNTNRSIGTTYRDYISHTVMVGVSWAI